LRQHHSVQSSRLDLSPRAATDPGWRRHRRSRDVSYSLRQRKPIEGNEDSEGRVVRERRTDWGEPPVLTAGIDGDGGDDPGHHGHGTSHDWGLSPQIRARGLPHLTEHHVGADRPQPSSVVFFLLSEKHASAFQTTRTHPHRTGKSYTAIAYA
jgi:hypothetical protein